jgi:hypothetical protein
MNTVSFRHISALKGPSPESIRLTHLQQNLHTHLLVTRGRVWIPALLSAVDISDIYCKIVSVISILE